MSAAPFYHRLNPAPEINGDGDRLAVRALRGVEEEQPAPGMMGWDELSPFIKKMDNRIAPV